MHSNCILDSVSDLLVRHMVLVGNVQKSPIVSHLKGLDLSLDFCSQSPALTGIKKGAYDERPHQLKLIGKWDVLVPPYDLQSRKSCCWLGYPGKNLRFSSFVTDDCHKVLEVLHFFKPLIFYLNLSLETIWVVSSMDRSPLCTLWWFYQDGLPGSQLLLPLLHLRQCHLQSGSW